MAQDNSKLYYYDGWDIDQLIAAGDVAVGSGTTLVYTKTANAPVLFDFEIQFKPAGSNRWYQTGSYATSNTLATSNSFSTYVQDSSVYITVPTTGIARYYAWADKVNY